MVNASKPARVHLVTGGFPAGSSAGHDIEFVRLELLSLLGAKEALKTTVSNNFDDIETWLPASDLLVTYVAGPFLTEPQSEGVLGWLEGGGRWLALHGTSGGKAIPLPDGKPGRMMSRERHHEVLGTFFLNHPPIRKFTVDVRDSDHPLTRGLPKSFEVMDELYLIELGDPEQSQVLLTTSDLDADDPAPREFGFTYKEDTSVGEDGRTRVLAYERARGQGAVAYIAMGHCHTPTTNIQPYVDASVDPEGVTPLQFRGPWAVDAYRRLIANGIDWGVSENRTGS
ncbi:ThuA domain-containing protein [Myxococcota bacterium]|nr:ThuA domain-containing protein [Myxococcota bacterium]